MSYFYNQFTDDTLNKAYELLENVTPLNVDCGKLCEHKCCKGNNKDGMLLFPGEEEFFENSTSFSVYYNKTYDCKCVTCNGICKREDRPLSCRIFPYFLYVISEKEQQKGTVSLDVRAIEYCPLADNDIKISKDFLRKMRMTLKVLMSDKKQCEFLQRITSMITDFGKLSF